VFCPQLAAELSTSQVFRIHTALCQHHNLTRPRASDIPVGGVAESGGAVHSNQLSGLCLPMVALCGDEAPRRPGCLQSLVPLQGAGQGGEGRRWLGFTLGEASCMVLWR
jgi:hypothetical protein